MNYSLFCIHVAPAFIRSCVPFSVKSMDDGSGMMFVSVDHLLLISFLAGVVDPVVADLVSGCFDPYTGICVLRLS